MNHDSFITVISVSVVGFIFGLPIIYSWFNKYYWESGVFPPVMLGRSVNRYEATINIAVHLLLCDKNEYKRKQQVLQRFLYYEFPEIEGNMGDSLISAINQRVSVSSTAKWLQKKIVNPVTLERYLKLMFNIAAIDEVIGKKEQGILFEISDIFKLDRKILQGWTDDHRRIQSEKFTSERRQTFVNNKKHFYTVLGLGEEADEAAIKGAYRKLVKKYHPDMQRNQSDPEAKRKFIEIRKAYEALSENN